LALLTGGMRLALHRGEVLVFFCAVSFAMHIVAVGRLARQYDPAVLAIVQIATVAVLSAGCALVWENPPQELTRPVLTALALTALPATALAFLVQNSVQRYTSATHTGVIFTMEPVFAAAYAYLWGGEVLTRLQWLGSGLILAGMLTAELGDGSEAARQPTGEVEPALE
ncbi:MAG: DMT family transporter, partial [Syntrophomonadaceae bacterium]|nr:DMT family transporter [Syntrophomonadaceae bacterium]